MNRLTLGYLKGVRSCSFAAAFAKGKRLRMELYIDVSGVEKNPQVLEALRVHLVTHAPDYAATLAFEELPGKQAQ